MPHSSTNVLLLAAAPAMQNIDALLKELSQFKMGSPEEEEDAESFFAMKRARLEELELRFGDSVKILSETNAQWLQMALDSQRAAAERTAIEDEYSDMAADKNGLLWLMQHGRTALSTITCYVKECERALSTVATNGGSRFGTPTPQQNVSISQVAPHMQQIMSRLPQLQLMTFDGDPKKWVEFRDSFQSAVANTMLPSIDKLHYLRSCLKGVAARSIEGYATTSDNFDVVWNFLHERFGDNKLLLRTLYAELHNIRKNDRDLRSTYEVLERVFRQLENMQENLNHPYLEMIVKSKLPQWALEKIFDAEKLTQNWTMQNLRSELANMVKKKEAVSCASKWLDDAFDQPAPTFHLRPQFRVTNNEQRLNRSSAFPTIRQGEDVIRGNRNGGNSSRQQITVPRSGQQADARPRDRCAFCSEQHWSNECRKFSTVDSRMNRARELHICFKCFQTGHMSNNCTKRIKCFYCKAISHISAFCRNRQSNVAANVHTHSATNEVETAVRQEATGPNIITSSAAVSSKQLQKEEVLLQCCEVTLTNPKNPKISVATVVFFDSGSQRSYITEELASKLQLQPIAEENLAIAGFADTTHESYSTAQVRVGIKLKNGAIQDLSANTMKNLTPPLQYIHLNDADKMEFRPSRKWSKPQLLVGMDYYFTFLTDSMGMKLNSGLYLIPSTVGYIVAGKGSYDESRNELSKSANYHSPTLACSVIEKTTDVEKFWSLETIGITDSPCVNEDEEALQYFARTINREASGRYSVAWPFRSRTPNLLSNYGLAFGRLTSTWKRLSQNPILLQQYIQTITEQLNLGVIEEAPKDSPYLTYYIPHQAVMTPQKETTKLRVVYDASASPKKGLSLNENLYRGPILLPELVGILLRFRMNSVVLTGDLEKAFLQVSINEDQRDVTRFLWLRDPVQPPSHENLVVFRFTRVPFGIVCSPFLLAAVIQHHLEQSNTPLASEILRNLYVDNMLLTFQSAQEATAAYKEVKQLFKSACMNIRMFLSNNAEVNNAIPAVDRQTLNERNSAVKILGLHWNPRSDVISWIVNKNELPLTTKRQILSFVAAIYDPLGILSPATLPLKLFLQNLWKGGFDWDQLLPREQTEEWQKTMKQWSRTQLDLPRQIIRSEFPDNIQLHCFVDASSKAYAAAVYVRENVSATTFATHLLIAKTRLAPLKGVTIPKLELLAAFIGNRLLKFTAQQLQLGSIRKFLWSDSKCTLHWIANEVDQFPRFIKNRLQEIQKEKDVKYGYVNTVENPADVATRGISPDELRGFNQWWYGPEWLKKEEAAWPKWRISTEEDMRASQTVTDISRTQAELCSETAVKHSTEKSSVDKDPIDVRSPLRTTAAASAAIHAPLTPALQLIDAYRFSNWPRMVKTTVFALRFLKKLSKEKFPIIKQISTNGTILPEEYALAENILIRQAQVEQLNEAEKNRWELIADKFQIFHCRGRLPSNLIFLPQNSYITQLLILHTHVAHAHCGTSQTLNQLRQEYWLPKGRATVRNTIKRLCMHCKRWESKPFGLPPMPDLPSDRITQQRPFQATGIDYFGPINIKSDAGIKKKWISLFTCLSTRAIHLEAAADLSGEAFLQCFRRFIARYDSPHKIFTDNGSNFQLASKTILAAFLAQRKIEWKFFPAHAPWQGGIYERMIGITKNAMKRAIGKKCLNEEELSTLLAEITRIVNSRPLTYVPEENVKVIRPIDFLNPWSEHESKIPLSNEISEGDEEYLPNNASSRDQLLKRWKASMRHLDSFWEKWRDEYLNTLRERTQRQHQEARSLTKREPLLNEVVILNDENQPRGCWQLASIVRLPKGAGGHIRSATIRLSSGRELTRPINLLYPLEVREETVQPTSSSTPAQSNIGDAIDINNLQAVSTRQLRSHTKIARANEQSSCAIGISPASKKFFFLALITVIIAATKGDNTFYICGRERHGLFLSMPRKINCTQPKNTTIKLQQVGVYTRSFFAMNATFCSKVTRLICTKAFLRFSLEVVKDETEVSSISTSDCLKLHSTKMVDGAPLLQVSPHKWKSTKPTTYSYGWFGKRCEQTTNFQLEEGVVQLFDGLSRTAGCNATAGKCVTPKETILWNASMLNKVCPYKKLGVHNAQIVSNMITVDALQAAFVKAKNPFLPPLPCDWIQPRAMENGLVIDFKPRVEGPQRKETLHIEPQESKNLRTLMVERIPESAQKDPINVRLQFLTEKIEEEERNSIRRAMRQVCRNHNKIIDVLIWISRTDPTAVARLLMSREDVAARNVGELLKVWKCTGFQLSEVLNDHKIEGKCFEDLPVRIGSETFFVRPRSRELTKNSREINCQEIQAKKVIKPGFDFDAVDGETAEIIFKANRLPSLYENRLFLTVDKLEQAMGESWAGRGKDSNDEFSLDEIRNDAEKLVIALGEEFDTAAQNIQEELDVISKHWKMCTTLAMVIAVGIFGVVVYLKCLCIRALFSKCTCRIRKQTNRRRRNNSEEDGIEMESNVIEYYENGSRIERNEETGCRETRFVPSVLPKRLRRRSLPAGNVAMRDRE